jgi:hypothetical protein
MPQGNFAVLGAQGASFGFASTAIALPGTGSLLRVANLGPCHITVAIGTTNAVTVTQSTGTVVLAGQVEWFTVAAGNFIAGVAAGGPGNASTVNIATGT